MTLLQNDAQGSAGVDAVQTEITSKLIKNACNNVEKLKVYLFTKRIDRRAECNFIHFSIRYHIIHFQDNAVNDAYPWTLDDGFAPSKDKGVVCSKISVT